MNEYFVLNANLPEPNGGFALPPLMFKTSKRTYGVDFTPVKVHKVLKSLNVAKANGPDNISNIILKETAEVMSKPLADLFMPGYEWASAD